MREQRRTSPPAHVRLVKQIVSLEIDSKLLTTLLAYYAGRPAVALDHRVEGTLTLAELIVGSTTPDDEDLERDEPRGESPATSRW